MTTLASNHTDDVEELTDSAVGAWETLVGALPRVGIAAALLVVFVVVGRLARPLVRKRLSRQRTPSFARVFARLTSSAMTVAGMLLAITIIFPSVQPVDVLTGAGVLTIAAGFAFQDILQNLLAGILLLFRQPFRGGDQVEVGEVVGTVDEINIRETVVTTFDGRRVLIPNAKVYTDVISVQTAHGCIRADFVVGVAYHTDMATAREVALAAVGDVEGVLPEPRPEAIYVGLGQSVLQLKVLLWCDARELEMRRTVDRAVEAVKVAFDRRGIEMPPEVIALQATPSFAAAVRPGPRPPARVSGSGGDGSGTRGAPIEAPGAEGGRGG